jgi:two-component sensor histidine kinase
MVKLLGVLLQSCVVGGNEGCETRRPLWAEERIHRAHNLLKLVLLLEQRPPQQAYDLFTSRIELSLAEELGNHYRSLAIGPERQVAPCSSVLREVVGDLVALFGPTTGPIELHTDIERVALPAYQRRALVLVASELVMNALLHAFKRRPEGRLTVELHRLGLQYARLRVVDDGIGCHSGLGNDLCGVAAGLADLLGSILIGRSNYPHGTIAEITFPLNN